MNHTPSSDTTPLPAQPFFSTPQARLALARQRYFEDGVRPSGLVSEGVIQSWSRCLQARRTPQEQIAFDPVTPSRIHSALARSELLLQAAAPDLERLEVTLAGTRCNAILTDPHGVVVHATRSADDDGAVLLPLARRVGVSLDEHHIGTGAPAVAMRTGQLAMVLGAEHFFGHLQVLHCAAAPIRDVSGRIAAILDLTCESRPFGFDAAAVVAICATTIENQLLRAQSTEHIVLQLQTLPGLMGTPMEGLAGLTSDGRVAWVNTAGARLLGLAAGASGLHADEVLALDMAAITRLTRASRPQSHRLPSGLTIWLAATLQARDGAARVFGGSVRAIGAAPTSATPAATLRASDQQLIDRTVQACGGNVSKAARQLGVSRGLIYRRLRQAAGR